MTTSLCLLITLANRFAPDQAQHTIGTWSWSKLVLTHISLASFFLDLDKQCRPRSDATECGVWSGSPLFAYKMFYENSNKNVKYHPRTLKTGTDWSSWYQWEIPLIIPPANFVCRGYTVFTLSVRVCVRPSVTLCFLNNSKSHCWIFIKLCKHVHICKTNTLDKKVRARGQFY